MEKIIFTQLTAGELKELIEECISAVLKKSPKHSKEAPPKEILNTKEVAKLLSLSVQTVYGLIYRNKIPSYRGKGSNRRYFHRQEIMEWLSTHRQSTSDEEMDQVEEYLNKKRRR